MDHTLFHVLIIVNTFCMATENPIAGISYRFEVYLVDKCPMNKTEFEEAAMRKNCSRDTRYLCAPDRNLSNLIEFCTDVRRSLFGPDNCVRLQGTGNLNHYNCKEFSSGCPSTPYFDDEIYRYPACLSITRDLNCFVADTNCTERLCNTTALEMCLNNSKSEDSTSKMGINTSKTHSNMNKIIISVVCVFVIIVTVVIGMLGLYFYKRLRKTSGKTKMKMDEEKLNDFLNKKEFTVRHVRCILVGCGGAGKTTLLRRLQNAKYKDLKKIKTTELVDVHVNIFDVLENKTTIQGVHTEKRSPLITLPPNLLEKIDTTLQLDGTPFTAEQMTKENDISENGVHTEKRSPLITLPPNLLEKIDTTLQLDGTPFTAEQMTKENDISENEESSIDDFKSMDGSENEEISFFDSAEERIKFIQLAPRNKPLSKEDKPDQILEENETNSYTNPICDNSAKYAFSKIMDAVKELSSDDHLCPRITFLDFAGQSMYYAFQQIYFSAKTCYILVVDMTKEPNEVVQETDYRCCSLFESWTYKDYYKFWLKLIDSYSDIDSPVILVGTHAENLSEQECKDFFRKFHALFKDHPDIPRHLNAARNFAIGFPEKGSKLADLKEIKTCIANIVNLQGYSDQIKPVWALFEHIMQEEKRRRIITRKFLSDYNDELSEEYRLNDENFTEMLLFLHRVGNLLYFDEDILRETIILDVQWFVNALKIIIEYHENIACDDHNSSRFKTTGEITDKELTVIWESNEGQTYISYKKEVLRYMEHFGLVAICNAQKGPLPFYYFPSMNNKKYKNQSNDFIKSSILCFQFNTDRQLPFNIFYRLVVKCLKKPEWCILQETNNQNCLYENVACFSYQHYIVVVCLCKFQIQLQVWNPERNELIDQELLSNIQRSVEETLSERDYLYKIGYKCKNGMFNAEEDDSFIAQTEFPVSKLNCPNCALGKKHLVKNEICWVHPRQSENTTTVNEEKDNGTKQELSAFSPLRIACEYGQDTEVQRFREKGAKINEFDKDGFGPLSISCHKGYNRSVQYLLNNDADINVCSKSGASPLYTACKDGHFDTVQLLLRNGAHINLCSQNGASPLFIACRYGHSEIVGLLLKEGADIDLCRKNGASPIYIACRYGHKNTVQLLLFYEADINLCRDSGVSPLYIACKYGHTEIVHHLLSKGADINFCSNDGTSPIHIACRYGHDNTVQRLLDNGADINLCSNSGASPLYIACRYGHSASVADLLHKGADINSRCKNGASPIYIACRYGHQQTMKWLLDNGADINLCTNSGDSPFSIACRYGHSDIFKLYLNNAADKNRYSNDGKDQSM